MTPDSTKQKSDCRKIMLDFIRPYIVFLNVLGCSPFIIRRQTLREIRASRFQTGYSIFILTLFIFEHLYLIIYNEVMLQTHFDIVNLTHLFHLFSENIISCLSIFNSIILSKTGFDNVQSAMRAEQLMCTLGLFEDSSKACQINILNYFFSYFSFVQAIFMADYYFLFKINNRDYFTFRSWIFLVIHVSYNVFSLVREFLSLKLISQRFSLLNRAMKELNNINVQNILTEINVLNTQKGIPNLTLKERVRMIKEAHDRYYRILAKGWSAANQLALLEIVTCGILITSYMYTVIGMVIDEQYDYPLLLHCCLWTVYGTLVIILLVLTNAGVCYQVTQSLV